MRRLWRGLRLGLIGLALAVVALWLFGPREPVDLAHGFDPARIGADPAAWLAQREAVFDDIRPGAHKRVIWADQPGARQALALVYLHGFSASAEEIRPVPDRLAADLGANLVFARLAGHGRSDPDAMGAASVADWMHDTAEALAVARAIGDEVVILATSTGGTLAALAALDPALSEGVRGIIFVAPNFGINSPYERLLTFPGARVWLPWITGPRRSFTPRNDAQAQHWTTDYPVTALLPMAALVRYAYSRDFAAASVPALFYFSDDDQVVRAARTRKVAGEWGGPVRRVVQGPGPGIDAMAHVITGDIISPATTEIAIAMMRDWVAGLEPRAP